MSSNSLRIFSAKLCRQTYILAQRHTLLSPVNAANVRRTHDGLYMMVKKRTLEARTKMNPPQEPIDRSDHQNSKQSSSMNSSQASFSSSLSAHPRSKSPIPQFTKGVKTSAKKDAEKTKHPCDNTNLLEASGCRPTARTAAPAGCEETPKSSTQFPSNTNNVGASGGKVGGSSSNANKGGGTRTAGSGGSGGDKNDESKLPKALLLLLTALGAGGLIYWLTRGGSSATKETQVVVPDDSNDDVCQPKEKSVITPPVITANLPHHVPYLIIGGGTAAFSAFRAIKSNDAHAKVLMITNECRKPYMRPPLSKELWYSAKNGETTPDYRFKQWTGAERSLFFEPEEFFIDPGKLMDNPNGGIAVAQGLAVKKIDAENQKVTLSNGTEICYNSCLIATGCSPKILPVLQTAAPSVRERVMAYRTPDDFERLKRYADQNKSIMIIGNGFIGSELACSLASYTKGKCGKIYQVFAETGNMSRVFPDYLSKWTTRKVQEQGVCVIPNASVRAAHRDESSIKVMLNNGNTIVTDVVVVSVGCEPNTKLAHSSGLEIHPELGGFVVNAELEARQNLFVAGDASCFYDPVLGRRRVEHHDHSVVSGRLAGENMVGKKKPYTHQSMFWSDLGPEIGYEAIGLVDASLPTVGVFALSSPVERPANVDNLTENRTQSDVVAVPRAQNCDNKEIVATNDSKCLDDDTYKKGVVFYLKDDKVVGILLWNLFNRIGLARTIIKQNKKYEDLNEVAKHFEIHS